MIKTFLIKLINLYQSTLSLLIGRQCRFYPSCSQNTKEAIEINGPAKGSILGLKRISHCHPWHEGGIDLVPGSNNKLSQSK